ncbi:MAG: hypothetical protein HY721_04515 [Planctomycetes bacterium]|nr:hypothetical protein [Planctomycetota bacterium]
MRLRPGPACLRSSILVANVLLALGVPALAVYGYLPRGGGKSTAVCPAGTFVDEGGQPGALGERSLDGVAKSFEPPAPAKEPEPPSPPVPPPAPSAGSGGPLAEAGWTYAWYMLRDDPRRSQVVLEREEPAAAPAQVRRPAGKLPGRRPSDRVRFFVYEGTIRDEERGLDFVALAADAERFVYSLPGEGSSETELYALPFRRPGSPGGLGGPAMERPLDSRPGR